MQNLQEYHRPKTIDEAVELLRRSSPKTVVLGGGTWLNGEGALGHLREVQAVVDVADLGINKIETRAAVEISREPTIHIGAAVTLQTLLTHALTGVDSSNALHVLGEAAQAMAGLNIRNRATLGGAIATADSSSPLVTALLACNAELVTQVGDQTKILQLTGFLDYRERVLSEGVLITEVRMPLPGEGARAGYYAVARTPRDYPIVCVVAKTNNIKGRLFVTRIAVGGVAPNPLRLAALEAALDTNAQADFIEAELNTAVAALSPSSDYLGTAEYRKAMARVLVQRSIKALLSKDLADEA